MAATLENTARFLQRHRGLVLPVVAAGLIFVILVPLPPGLMDVLLVLNIALAAVILLTTIYVSSPLEFSVFPSVLLGATLLRLVLNVATTRLILTAGADGSSANASIFAAGRVIWTFSHLVTLGSLAVGVILFAILVVIQFIVITKGAGRISEVAARFVLDAMPGRQMAIDADLNAKLIDEAEARRRRSDVAREADFYGAMDGASKFLRGDAIAALIITAVNILGGLYIGLTQRGWTWSQTADLFTRLTIGDGLVTQIPAFIVSISAALLVTRSTAKTNLGEEMLAQLISRPTVLVITAIFLAALTLTSLPAGPLLMLGVGCVGLAWMLSRRSGKSQAKVVDAAPADAPGPAVEELLAVDPVRVEIGYALVPLVDPEQGGELLDRTAALRREIATELGFVVPPVRVRDEMRLGAHSYVIKLRGTKVAGGEIYPRQLLAVGGDGAVGRLSGRETVEPAFGTPAVWIGSQQRDHAERMNYVLVEPADVLMTHLAEVIRRYGSELLSRQRVGELLDGLAKRCGNLVREVSERFKVGQVQKVLQSLLRERASIGDLEAILEAMDDYAGPAEDLESLCEHVRSCISRTLCQQYCGDDGKLWCVSLSADLEERIRSRLERTSRGTAAAVSPDLARRMTAAVKLQAGRLRDQGRRPVVLCSPGLRVPVQQLIAPAMPDAAVLGYNEIDSVEVETVCDVGIES